MPDVIEFNRMIHINQFLNSKICNKIIENHESKSDFRQQLMKRIKKRFNIDQFLNSKCARKLLNFIDILVTLFGLFYATIRYRCKMKNDRQEINATKI